MTHLVIYHANCPDGLMSAAVAKLALTPKLLPHESIEFKAAQYDDVKPSIDFFRLKTVYIVDFSYPAEFIREIAKVATKIVLLDHHKSAQKDLEGQEFPPGVEIIFDMNRCGAAITYDYFYPSIGWQANRFVMVDYIQDRDLWQWKLPNSKEVSAYFSYIAQTIEDYAMVCLRLGFGRDTQNLVLGDIVTLGNTILCTQNKLVAKIAAKAYVRTLWSDRLGNTLVAFVNNASLISETCNEVLKADSKPDFVASWFDTDDGRGLKRVWSLRAAGKFDCSALAKVYGGGGHPNAAGFVTSTDFMLKELP